MCWAPFAFHCVNPWLCRSLQFEPHHHVCRWYNRGGFSQWKWDKTREDNSLIGVIVDFRRAQRDCTLLNINSSRVEIDTWHRRTSHGPLTCNLKQLKWPSGSPFPLSWTSTTVLSAMFHVAPWPTLSTGVGHLIPLCLYVDTKGKSFS